jgi:hypothetical protein
MPDFHSAAVRFGKPGKLYIAALGTAEPTTVSSAWAAGWVPLGYTAEGSVFNSELSTENVEVAEELEALAVATTGRVSSVEVALAEVTKRNLSIAYNGGTIIVPDGQNWTFEPPDLGSETRVMLGWDASMDPSTNDLRILFRRVLQVGSLGMENRKGATKSTLSSRFQLEKPADGAKSFKIFGAGTLNPV